MASFCQHFVVSSRIFPHLLLYRLCPLSTATRRGELSRAQVLKSCEQSLKAEEERGWETEPGRGEGVQGGPAGLLGRLRGEAGAESLGVHAAPRAQAPQKAILFIS